MRQKPEFRMNVHFFECGVGAGAASFKALPGYASGFALDRFRKHVTDPFSKGAWYSQLGRFSLPDPNPQKFPSLRALQ
jgi:hypothetical protein